MTVDQVPGTTTSSGHDTGLGRPVPQSADPIDRVVRLAPRWTVFVLIACGLLVIGTVVWAVAGTVTTDVSARAFYSQTGGLEVKSDAAATVASVMVALGDSVTKGQPLVSLTNKEILRSPQDGSVTSILVSDGSVMWAGKVALRVTDLSQSDVVVAAAPVSLTGTIVPGLPVRMEVSSAPPSKYGYLLGTVDEVSQDPYTTPQIADRLDLDPEVVAALLGTEPALLVVVRLIPDSSTPSGYQWSVGEGPPFVITTGVPVNARIVLSEERPIDVVFS